MIDYLELFHIITFAKASTKEAINQKSCVPFVWWSSLRLFYSYASELVIEDKKKNLT